MAIDWHGYGHFVSTVVADKVISKKKAIESLAELEAIGLVEKKQRGLGQPNILYVKDFITSDAVVWE